MFCCFVDCVSLALKSPYGERSIKYVCMYVSMYVSIDHILDTLKECDLEVRNLKSFVSDGASVMTGEHNGVAARLKRVNKVLLNFHCICHRLALACADTGDSIKYIGKPPQGNVEMF